MQPTAAAPPLPPAAGGAGTSLASPPPSGTASVAPRLTLERVIGCTSARNAAFSVSGATGDIAWAAGAVVVLYSVARNRQTRFFACRGPVSCLAFSRSGGQLAAGTRGLGCGLHVWDVATGAVVAEMADHTHGVACLAWSADDALLLSAGFVADRSLHVWRWAADAAHGRLVATGRLSQKVHAIAVSETGAYFVTAGDRHLKFWSTEPLAAAAAPAGALPPITLSSKPATLSEGGPRMEQFMDVVCGAGPHAGRVYALTSAGILCAFDAGERLMDQMVDLRCRAGLALDANAGGVLVGCSDGVVRVFSPSTLTFVGSLHLPPALGRINVLVTDASVPPPSPGDVTPAATCVRWGAGGARYACVVYGDRSLFVWDVADLERPVKVRSQVAHAGAVLDVALYPNKRSDADVASPPAAAAASVPSILSPTNSVTSTGSGGGGGGVGGSGASVLGSLSASDQRLAFPDDTFATVGADCTVRFWNLDPRATTLGRAAPGGSGGGGDEETVDGAADAARGAAAARRAPSLRSRSGSGGVASADTPSRPGTASTATGGATKADRARVRNLYMRELLHVLYVDDEERAQAEAAAAREAAAAAREEAREAARQARREAGLDPDDADALDEAVAAALGSEALDDDAAARPDYTCGRAASGDGKQPYQRYAASSWPAQCIVQGPVDAEGRSAPAAAGIAAGIATPAAEALAAVGLTALAIRGDGAHVAVGDRQGNVRVFDVATGSVAAYELAHDAAVATLSYAPSSGRLLASGSSDTLVHVFESRGDGYGLVTTIGEVGAPVSSAVFTQNDGQLVVGARSGSVLFSRVSAGGGTSGSETVSITKQRVAAAPGGASVTDADVDAANKSLVTVGGDARLHVWGLKTGRVSRSFAPDAEAAAAGGFSRLALDPSGMYAAAAAASPPPGSRCLWLFDVFTGACMAAVQGHGDAVTGIVFTADGRRLISVDAAGCIFVWRLSATVARSISDRLAEMGRGRLQTPQPQPPSAATQSAAGGDTTIDESGATESSTGGAGSDVSAAVVPAAGANRRTRGSASAHAAVPAPAPTPAAVDARLGGVRVAGGTGHPAAPRAPLPPAAAPPRPAPAHTVTAASPPPHDAVAAAATAAAAGGADLPPWLASPTASDGAGPALPGGDGKGGTPLEFRDSILPSWAKEITAAAATAAAASLLTGTSPTAAASDGATAPLAVPSTGKSRWASVEAPPVAATGAAGSGSGGEVPDYSGDAFEPEDGDADGEEAAPGATPTFYKPRTDADAAALRASLATINVRSASVGMAMQAAANGSRDAPRVAGDDDGGGAAALASGASEVAATSATPPAPSSAMRQSKSLAFLAGATATAATAAAPASKLATSVASKLLRAQVSAQGGGSGSGSGAAAVATAAATSAAVEATEVGGVAASGIHRTPTRPVPAAGSATATPPPANTIAATEADGAGVGSSGGAGGGDVALGGTMELEQLLQMARHAAEAETAAAALLAHSSAAGTGGRAGDGLAAGEEALLQLEAALTRVTAVPSAWTVAQRERLAAIARRLLVIAE